MGITAQKYRQRMKVKISGPQAFPLYGVCCADMQGQDFRAQCCRQEG